MADIKVDTKHHITGLARLETEAMSTHALVSWRAIVAGLMVALFGLAILLSLGMAFGGVGLSNGTNAQNAGVFTGVWFLISSIIALFVGSYFAARVSKFHTGRVGSAQGAVIAALFFGFFLYQTFTAIGFLGKATGAAVGGTVAAASVGVSQASDNPTVNNIIENAMGDLNLKSDPKTVVSGVANRLLRGDTTGAKNYLASQAGITPTEADRRIADLRAQVDQAMMQARDATAKALQATGWSLFATMVLGALAAMGGGALGSSANLHRPLVREHLADSYAGLKPATI